MPSLIKLDVENKPRYQNGGVKFRTVLSKLVHFLGSRVPFENLL